MKKVLLILLLVLFGCTRNVELSFKEGLKANEVKLSNREKNEIIDYLTNYEFKYEKRDEFLYGGAVFVIEYEVDGITHHWDVSGSGNECKIREKENTVYYFTYDMEVIQKLAKYAY